MAQVGLHVSIPTFYSRGWYFGGPLVFSMDWQLLLIHLCFLGPSSVRQVFLGIYPRFFLETPAVCLAFFFLLEVTNFMVGRIKSVYSLNQLILFDFLRWAHAHTDTRTHTDTQTHTVWNGPYLGYRSVCCFGSSDRTVKVLPRTPQGIQGKVTLWLGVDRARGKRPQGTQCYTLGIEPETPWGHISICTQTHKHTHTHRHILFIRDTGAYGTVDGLYSSNPAEASEILLKILPKMV